MEGKFEPDWARSVHLTLVAHPVKELEWRLLKIGDITYYVDLCF
jgi:hypothetical protein